MADPGIERVRPLAEALRDGELTRVRVNEPGFEIELRRAARTAAPAAAVAAPAPGGGVTEPSVVADILVSDVVGILRHLRPPVGEGHAVEAGRELAFVEALGVRNPVRTRASGRVSAVYVEDGMAVEYGQPLFAVER